MRLADRLADIRLRWIQPSFDGYTKLRTNTFEGQLGRRDGTASCTKASMQERCAWIMLTVVLLAIIVWQDTKPALIALGEINGLIPSFSALQVVQFPFENATSSGPSLDTLINDSMEAWADTMPIGGGFIAVDHLKPEATVLSSVRLPPAIHTPASDPSVGYGISVFHQLHCLRDLQTTLNGMISGIKPIEHFGHKHIVHMYHCFAYLRRAITCAADTALEGQSSGTDLPATAGEGSFHACRNFEAVKAYAIEHRLTDQ